MKKFLVAVTFFVTPPPSFFFFLKEGSTSAGCNSAFKTPYPLCHTYSETSGQEDKRGPPVAGAKMHLGMPGNKYFSSFGQLWVIQPPTLL